MIQLLGGHRRKAMSLTQAEKKEEEKERSEVEGRDERKRQRGERKKAREGRKGFPFTSPLA